MKGSDDRAGSPNNAAKELATAPEVGLRFWHDLPILNEAGADVSRAVTAGKPFRLSAKRF